MVGYKRYVFVFNNVVNLGFEIYVKYVISFIENEVFDVVK